MRWPETWAEVPLAQLVESVQPGFAQAPGDEDSGTVPQIRTHNVSPEGQITLAGIKHVSPDKGELERYSLASGDIVFNNTNSEDWVGKTALFRDTGQYVFSNHMTRIRAKPDVVDPEYLARYLHFLWAMGFSRNRSKRWVSQAAIDVSTLLKFKVALPTLPEQRRIIELFRQSDEIFSARRSAETLMDELVRATYGRFFGQYYSAAGLSREIRLGKFLADVQYGVSEAMDDSGTHAILRMNNLTTSGWLDLSDLKYANLSAGDAATSALKPGDILFNRTNSQELVGKCVIWRSVDSTYSFASYLLRLRLKHGLLPEYVWGTLNSPYGKFRLFNAAKQAVNMANISPTDLARIPIPQPPIEEQERFASIVREIEAVRSRLREPAAEHLKLNQLLQRAAIVGQLTENWRESRLTELEDADAERSKALGAQRLSLPIAVHAPPERKTTLLRPARAWLTEQLSPFQEGVHLALYEWKGTVIPDDAEVFDNFCQQWPTEHGDNAKDRIGRALEQLAALGLVAKVSLRNEGGDFVTGFRPLRDQENTRLIDAERVTSRLLSSTRVGENSES